MTHGDFMYRHPEGSGDSSEFEKSLVGRLHNTVCIMDFMI